MARRHDNTLLLTTLVAGGFGALVAGRYLARRRRYFDPAGKVALITGGSRGLGLVLARHLLQMGARVAICARDEEELNRARTDLSDLAASQNDLLAVQCDLTKPLQIPGMIDGIRRHFGPIDILINNAGIIQVGPVEHMTEEDFRAALDLHFWAPYYTIREVLPDMRTRQSGRIVNISSIGGKIPPPHLAPYAASKFALTGFSQSLRPELLRDGIYVTTVSPGLMRTGSPRQIDVKGQVDKEYAWFKVGDSLPGLSMSADRAARKIIDAMIHGDADLTLTMLAKFGARFHALFPNLSLNLNSLVNALLPAPGGSGSRAVKGAQAESKLSRSPLTTLTDQAAQRNNEMGDPSSPS